MARRANTASGSGRGALAAPLGIALVVFLAYTPALFNGFANLDDQLLIVENPYFHWRGGESLRWMFTTFYAEQYHPFTWLTYTADHAIWGLNPFGYHLSSVLIHMLNAALVYALARRLLRLALGASGESGGAAVVCGAACAALFFGLHPLRVEAIAWVSERRGILCVFFYLLSLLAYLRHAEKRGGHWLWWAFLAAVAAFLAKSLVVSLPAVMLILDVYPLRRLGGSRGWLGRSARSVWLEKAPFAFLALAAIVAVKVGYESLREYGSWSQHLLAPAYGCVFYLARTLWPEGLSANYQFDKLMGWNGAVYLMSVAAVVGLSAAFWRMRKRWAAGLALWLAYLATLSPVSGVVPIGHHIAADRYAYLSGIAWAIFLGGCCRRAFVAGPRRLRLTAMAAMVVILMCLAGMTERQISVWRNGASLWRRAVALDDSASASWSAYGETLLDRGAREAAIMALTRSIALSPGSPAHNARGYALMEMGDYEGSLNDFDAAIRLGGDKPNYKRYSNRGRLHYLRRQYEAALRDNLEARRLRPDNAPVLYNCGMLSSMLGRYEDALRFLDEALELAPTHLNALRYRAEVLARLGRREEALADVARYHELGGEQTIELTAGDTGVGTK